MCVTIKLSEFEKRLDVLFSHTECHYNSSNGKCNYKCKVFRNGTCNNWHAVMYDTHEDQLIENLAEAKGEFYIMALKALVTHASITDILIDHYEYT